jgi:hypothetical protein
MTYYKLITNSGPVYRSFNSDDFICIELFNGTIHKRMAKIENKDLYNHMLSITTSDNGFVETTEEEFTLNKTEILSILNG